MNKDQSPCKGCIDRAVGCHGKCSRYIEWQRDHETKRAEEYNRRPKKKFFRKHYGRALKAFRHHNK